LTRVADNLTQSSRRGIVYTLVASTLFGVNGAVAGDLVKTIPPGNVAQIRSVLAALVLGAIAYRRRLTQARGRLLALAALGLTLATVTVSFFVAIDRLGVGPGVTIQFTGPVLVLGWQRLVEKRRVGPLAWAAALVALVGVGLVSRVGTGAPLDSVGLLAASVASITFAAYILLSSYLARSFSIITVAAYGFSFSALILLTAFPVVLPPNDPLVWLELAWLLILGTITPFLLEMAAVKIVDPGLVGVIATFEPVMAATAAWIGLGQRLTAGQIAGGLLVVMAVALIERYSSRPPLGP
jgi:drug/metabolite transporter (DMT)-like permease